MSSSTASPGRLLPARSTARARNWYSAPNRRRGSVPLLAPNAVSSLKGVLAGFAGGWALKLFDGSAPSSGPIVFPGRGAHKLQPAQRNRDSGSRRSVELQSADWDVATVTNPSSENVRVSGPFKNL